MEVARLAGVPVPVVQRARAILAGLERGREGARKAVALASMPLPGLDLPQSKGKDATADALPEIKAAPPATEHPLVLLLHDLAPDTLSPLDALKLLMEWKRLWGTKPDADNGNAQIEEA